MQGIITHMNSQDAPLQQVLTLPGAAALSPFRVEKLLASLPPSLAEAITVDARYVHFAAVIAPLSDAEHGVLEKLLTYGTAAPGGPRGVLLLVLPRFGTVSPWSSKATDIARNCGLVKVARIGSIDGDKRHIGQVDAPAPVGGTQLVRQRGSLSQRLWREAMRNVVLADGDLDFHARIVDLA